MNVEIGTEAALFPEKECISGIFVAVHIILMQNSQQLSLLIWLFLILSYRLSILLSFV
jgi:hypothetical protein